MMTESNGQHLKFGESMQDNTSDMYEHQFERPISPLFRSSCRGKFQQHESFIVQEILKEQDLSRAGYLFTLSNDVLLNNFPLTIELIKTIIDSEFYISNLNQQSIVEIVLTRCISALRETKMIVNYYDDLLDLLDICLKYNLNCNKVPNNLSFRNSLISTKDYYYYYDYDPIMNTSMTLIPGSTSNNTPHANIVSDILSCILSDYLDIDLSAKAIPYCIKLIQHSNCKHELLREITSYLSLIACRSSNLLINHVYYIVSGMLKAGTNQFGLAHLLFQISEAHIECIYPLVKHLVKSLKMLSSSNDLLNIFQIMYLVSINHVQLIIVHLDDLIVFLGDELFNDILLDIIFSISTQTPIALDSYLILFENPTSIYFESYKIDKILSTVGKSLRKKSEYCTNLLIERIKYLINRTVKINSLNKRLSRSKSNENDDDENLIDKVINDKEIRIYEYQKRYIQILSEIYDIANVFPNILNQNLKKICSLFHNPPEDIQIILDKFKHLKYENSSVCSSSRDDLGEDFKIDTKAGNDNIDIDTLDKQVEQDLLNIEISKLKDDINKVCKLNIDEYNKDIEDEDDFDSQNERTKKEIEDFMKTFDKELDFSENEDINNFYEDSLDDNLNENNQSNKVVEQCESPKYEECESIQQVSVTTYKPILNEACNYSITSNKFEEQQNEQTESLIINNLSPSSDSFRIHLDEKISKANHPISSTIRIQNDNQDLKSDVVNRFFLKHFDKVKSYVSNLNQNFRLPIPDYIEIDNLEEISFDENSDKSHNCTHISTNNSYRVSSLRRTAVNSGLNDFLLKKFKSKRTSDTSIKFSCSMKSNENCLFNFNFCEIPTSYVSIWIHLKILSIQANLNEPLSQQNEEYSKLRLIYERLNDKMPFNLLATSSFPSEKQLNDLKNELVECRIFDLFEFNCDNNDQKWSCFVCANPERSSDLFNEKPLIQGQLKEKHGKWKFLRRWHKRLFTLTGGNIIYFKKDMRQESLNVKYIKEIQSVRSSCGHKSKTNKDLPKAFEIFTKKNSFILKAENSNDAEKWIQYLQITKAFENKRSHSATLESNFIQN